MTGRLQPILAAVAARARERLRGRSYADLCAELRPDPERRHAFVRALRGPRLRVLAECKRRSPSRGLLRAEEDLLPRALAYVQGGAAAISVLTEEDHFQGALADLGRVRAAGLPLLRKDFLLDPAMVAESALAGADAVLLIAAALPGTQLGELRACAASLGLAVLLEVHTASELERALAVEPDCIGVNARDLSRFSIDAGAFTQLLPQIPARFVRVAESGIRGPADAAAAAAAGADALLVGEALMRAADPAALLRALAGAGGAGGAGEC